MRSNVLIVDQLQAAMQIASVIAREYEVQTAHVAESALATIRASQPALVIAGLAPSGADGIELCRQIRTTSTVPVIVLARGADSRSEVVALDAGADDYITAPFRADQVLARLRAVLRRQPGHLFEPAVLSLDDVEIDFRQRRVRIQGHPVRLTPKEFDLFALLARHPNRVLPHRVLLEAVWGPNFDDHAEYLRVFVGQLRKKLERDPANPRYIVTEPWVGYRLNPTGSSEEQSAVGRDERRDRARAFTAQSVQA